MMFKIQFFVAVIVYTAVVDGSRHIRSPGNRGWEGSFDSNPSVSSARSSLGHVTLGRSSSWGGSSTTGSFGNGGYGAARSFGSGWDNTNAGSFGRSSNTGCNSGW